ncbi:hypothetical protein [Alteromonas halophila]|uniref:Uncharacterized protein n=1 Tax=Alteromonas halophila TaxID=516698 RepID=A0A918JIS6_9ALTE|nr:hypothetical protein [Alteromonas halophila]GGW82310.1 hypothetical protein GCM10007391_14180 [Alteromonas halophila]
MSLSKEAQFLSALEQQLTQQYSKQLLDAENPQQEMASSLGALAARVRIIEEVLAKEERGITEELPPLLPAEVTLTASHFASQENLHELETHNGREFRWSGADPRVDFALLVNRDGKKEVVIDVVAVAKSDLMKRLSLYADGIVLKFSTRQNGDILQLVAKLPKEPGKKDATLISILLPETVRPIEEGSSSDTRQLGIAISQLHVGEPKRRLARLAK